MFVCTLVFVTFHKIECLCSYDKNLFVGVRVRLGSCVKVSSCVCV